MLSLEPINYGGKHKNVFIMLEKNKSVHSLSLSQAATYEEFELKRDFLPPDVIFRATRKAQYSADS